MNKKSIFFPVILFLTLPMAVFAQNCPARTYENWVAYVLCKVATPAWQLFAGLAVIMFVVAGILFITSNGEPGKITAAKNAVIWAIVGIAVASVAFIIVQTVSSWV